MVLIRNSRRSKTGEFVTFKYNLFAGSGLLIPRDGGALVQNPTLPHPTTQSKILVGHYCE